MRTLRIVALSLLFSCSLAHFFAAPAHASFLTNGLQNTGSQAYDNTGTLRGQEFQLTEPRSPIIILAMIINGLLVLVGVFLTVLIVYHGFRWVLGSGNPETIKSARSALINAAIGLLIVMASFSVSYFVTRQFESASRGPQYQPGTKTQLPDDVQLNFKPF